jgi:hypothetical protein
MCEREAFMKKNMLSTKIYKNTQNTLQSWEMADQLKKQHY